MSFSSQFNLGALSFSEFTTGPFQFVVPGSLGVTSALELDGATIALATGTAMETSVSGFFRDNNMTYEPIPVTSVEEAERQFTSGAADVFVLPRSAFDDATVTRLLLRSGFDVLAEAIDGSVGPEEPEPETPLDDTVYILTIDPVSSLSGQRLGYQSAKIDVLDPLIDTRAAVIDVGTSPATAAAALLVDEVDGLVAVGTAERDAFQSALAGRAEITEYTFANGTLTPVNPRTPVPDDNAVYVFAFAAPASFDGAKLIASGAATEDDIKALGAIPVRVATPEWYAALQTGVVDGIVAIGATDRDALRALLPDEVKVFDVAGNSPSQGTRGDDDLVGTSGADDLKGLKGDDSIKGKGGKDTLNGGAGKDDISGNGGRDLLIGGGGRDKLEGDGGRDTLKGGGGNDRLDGGKGNDVLTGGKGADLFLFTFEGKKNKDTITDFNVNKDTIRAEDLDYRLRIENGDAVLKFGGGQVLTVEGVTQRKALKQAIETKAEPPVAESDPFLIYDLGGKFDKSFIQAAFEGAERWAEKTGDTYGALEITSDAQRERALDQAAQSSSPVVTVGFGFADALDKQAAENPDTEFAIIDAIVDQPNVTSYTFAEHEGAYLMGMFAAMASETDVVGFIGGQDIPLVRRYSTAFEAGAEAIDAGIEVIVNMTGSTVAAWNDPVKGVELAKAQIAQGADVIYAVAGGTGVGVLQAVADAGVLGIGNDSNQNYLHPGNMLTSMVKRVDVVVESIFDEGNNLPGGANEVGLADGAISYAFDDDNRGVLTKAMRDRVDAAIQDIASGDLIVPDYYDDLPFAR